MTGNNDHEKVEVNRQQIMSEIVAELLGINYNNAKHLFNIVYQGKTINPNATIEETDIREYEYIIIQPKLKGGAGGEYENIILTK